jgi:hypothetical protein
MGLSSRRRSPTPLSSILDCHSERSEEPAVRLRRHRPGVEWSMCRQPPKPRPQPKGRSSRAKLGSSSNCHAERSGIVRRTIPRSRSTPYPPPTTRSPNRSFRTSGIHYPTNRSAKLAAPLANDKRRTTNDERPTANDERPTTNDQTPTAGGISRRSN